MGLSSTKKTKIISGTVCTNNFEVCLVITKYRVLFPHKAVGKMWSMCNQLLIQQFLWRKPDLSLEQEFSLQTLFSID